MGGPEMAAELREGATKAMDKLCADAGIKVTPHIIEGDPNTEIQKAGERHRC